MKSDDPTRLARRRGKPTTGRSAAHRVLDEVDTLSEATWDASGDGSAQPWARRLERGDVLGRYVVIDVLGEGGMGVVYSAYDPDLDRRIALKLLHSIGGAPGSGGDPSARLLREAQALARLSHPNVVGVHDVGRIDDRVFVAMEHVDGPSLKGWLKERERSFREVVAVFREAGAGLAAAHASGLVHRDIKPDNIFLWQDGRVCIGDFGLARSAAETAASADATPTIDVAAARADATPTIDAAAAAAEASAAEASAPPPSDDDLGSHPASPLASPLTATGMLLGTPPYMSPEQHQALDTDHRTDQFSFCVTLYEALYGERPFAGKGILEVRDAILAGKVREAPKASDVPPWLRRALLRGLDADPERRYPSMDALLEALSRDPARSRRRLGLLAGGVGVAAVVALSLVTAGDEPEMCSGGTAELAAVWSPERKQRIAAAFESSGASTSAATWSRTVAILDHYGSQWAAMHRDACEATRVRGEQSERLLDARMLCLARRRAELDGLATLLADADPELVRAAVDAALSLSSIEACADQEALLARVPPPDDATVRAEVEAIERGLAEARATLTAGRHDAARELVTSLVERAAELGFDPVRAEAELLLGLIERLAGDVESAERNLLVAALRAQASRADDIAARAWVELVLVTGRDKASYDDGLMWARIAEASIDRLGEAPGLRSLLHNNRGAVLDARGDFAGSLLEYQAALAIDVETLADDDPDRAITLGSLGNASYRLGRYDDARDHYERALAIRVEAFGPEHPRVGESQVQLGLVLEAQGDLDGALAAYESGLAISERVFGPESMPVANSLSSIGGTYHALGRHADALAANERALAIRRAALGDDHPDLATNYNNIAIAKKNLGDYDGARAAYETALATFVRVHGENAFSVGVTLNNLGEVLRVEGKCDEALPRYQRSLEIMAGELGEDHPTLAHPLTGLGACHLDVGEPRVAIAELERALGLREKAGVSQIELAETRFHLARALIVRRSDRDRALELAEAARRAYADAGEGRESDRANVEAWLASLR